MIIGGHLSIAGGFKNALLNTKKIGGNSLQIFSTSPRNWNFTLPDVKEIEEFRILKNKFDINPVYFHASYLINLADNNYIGQRSVSTFIKELILAEKMGIKGTIIHLGSFKLKNKKPSNEQYNILFENIQKVLANTPKKTLFIIENAGNKKIGYTLEELGFIVKALNHPRLKICLDTCHLHASGYDLSTSTSFNEYLQNFEEQIGLDKLEVFQINDSKDTRGSSRDRHENLGEGQIPPNTFHLLFNDYRTKDLPFILETPGFDGKGPDKKNIEIMKNLQKKPSIK